MNNYRRERKREKEKKNEKKTETEYFFDHDFLKPICFKHTSDLTLKTKMLNILKLNYLFFK